MSKEYEAVSRTLNLLSIPEIRDQDDDGLLVGTAMLNITNVWMTEGKPSPVPSLPIYIRLGGSSSCEY